MGRLGRTEHICDRSVLRRSSAPSHTVRVVVQGWRSRRGYIPTKFTIPKSFTDKGEKCRQWKEDVADYWDLANVGMKELLEEIDVEVERVTENTVLVMALAAFDRKMLAEERLKQDGGAVDIRHGLRDEA